MSYVYSIKINKHDKQKRIKTELFPIREQR